MADCEPVIERNKVIAGDDDRSRRGRKNGMWLVGSIPTIICFKWLNEEGIDVFNKNHKQAVLRKLEDPEWRYLRTAPGALGKKPAVTSKPLRKSLSRNFDNRNWRIGERGFALPT